MAKTEYLQYTIYLTDAAQLATLQGAAHEGGVVGAIIMAPDLAATTYSAPKLARTVPFTAPSITSEWFDTEAHFPTNVKTFDRKSGGWFGIPFLFPTTTHYYWRGVFALAPTLAGGGTGGAPAAISQRRWIDGFELLGGGLGAASAVPGDYARKASRHVDGLGLAVGTTSTAQVHQTNEYAAITPNRSWERFYLRPHVFPVGGETLWKAEGSVEPLVGIHLGMTATGQLSLSSASNVGTLTLLAATPALVVERWYRVDLLVEFGSAAKVRLFLNGVLALDILTLSASNSIAGRTHIRSTLGAAFTGSVDVDDWLCADWPATLDGPDWVNGSHIQIVQPISYDAGPNVDWTGGGGWRTLLQEPPLGGFASLVSTVSAGRVGVYADGAMVDAEPNTLGVCAMQVSIFGSRVAGVQGQLFGQMQDAVISFSGAIVQASTANWQSILYRPSGLAAPVKMGVTSLVHLKGASVTSATTYALCAVVEQLGIFGNEDKTPALAAAAAKTLPLGVHNAPYPRTPWAKTGIAPQSPVVIHTGTYVGNGTFQELLFRAPVHWLWIRPTTLDSGGVRWWSSLLGAHKGLDSGPRANGMVQARINEEFVTGGEDSQQQQTMLRIVGNDNQSNQAGETYHYVAFSDPGMRFLLNGALATYEGTADATTPLINPAFLPVAAMLWTEIAGDTGTARLYYKGPGTAAGSLCPIGGAVDLANALTIAAGSLVSKAALHNVTSSAQQIAYALWRTDDGSGDPGVPRVCCVFSYTGDGAASRTLALAPASGRRPAFALITPHGAGSGAIQRDAAHTGTTSVSMTGSTNASTGITGGGVDTISVGIALNANAVVYDAFVLVGTVEACNNGWSCDGEFVPVDPASPPPGDGPWDPDPTNPEDPGPGGTPAEPPIDPTLPTDFQGQCKVASTHLVNLAISRLGESLQVVDLATELSPAAVQARLHYVDALDATLRDFPWPFATRYATLTLVAGTATVPVNLDWQYSYRAPSDLLFARRFVKPGGEARAYDPLPTPFRQGSDSTGKLIYSNQVAADARLEYTVRVTCAATQGDADFRSAFAWRLAHELAPTLCRDEKKVAMAWAMYERQIGAARVTAANESQPDQQAPDAPWITGRD